MPRGLDTFRAKKEEIEFLGSCVEIIVSQAGQRLPKILTDFLETFKNQVDVQHFLSML
jgi:hypothetical protein